MSDGASGLEDLYSQLDKYPWDSDPEFQNGLAAILGSTESTEQASELALRARCFYYERKFSTPVDFDAYKAWRNTHGTEASSVSSAQPSANGATLAATQQEPHPQLIPASTDPATQIAGAQQTSTSEPQAPYPTSFQRIVELITTGQPIPGIKDIPNTVLEGQATAAQKSQRRKPWEKDAPATENVKEAPAGTVGD